MSARDVPSQIATRDVMREDDVVVRVRDLSWTPLRDDRRRVVGWALSAMLSDLGLWLVAPRRIVVEGDSATITFVQAATRCSRDGDIESWDYVPTASSARLLPLPVELFVFNN